MKVFDIIARQRDNDKVAVIENGKKYSFKDIYQRVENYVSVLGKNKQKGNIGIYLENSIEYIIAFFVSQKLNGATVPIAFESKKGEIDGIIKYCDLSLIITNSAGMKILDDVILKKCSVFNIDTCECQYSETACDESGSVSNEVCLMMKTSGSTSAPKRVMLTDENVLFNLKAHIQTLKLTSEDKCLIVLPMCFSYCLVAQLLSHLYLGASLEIYMGLFIPRKFLLMLQDSKCTNVACVPSMIMLLKNEDCFKDNWEYLRYVLCGGSALSRKGLEIAKSVFGDERIVVTYGLTEAGPRVSTLLPKDISRKIGSVGQAMSGIKVGIAENMELEESGRYRVGEIMVQGPSIMKGYYKLKTETEAILKGGWLHTGDLGYIDEEGFIYIVGRKKNVIISAGLNIYPEEIEEILQCYPQVKESYVYSYENELLGEVPVADIVVEDPDIFSMEQLKKYCDDSIDINRRPREIHVVERIEKTDTGKIRRMLKHE